MSTDKQTLAFYDRKATDYANLSPDDKPDQDLRAFMEQLPKGASVLDLGCGPGRSTALMRDAGFGVEAWDASLGMAKQALDRFGIEVRLATFEMLDAVDFYDGVWANFSLLHAPKSAFAGHLTRIQRALKPSGVLHLGLKLGEGEKRDSLGRFYSYFTKEELNEALVAAGFAVSKTRIFEGTGLSGKPEPMITLIAHA